MRTLILLLSFKIAPYHTYYSIGKIHWRKILGPLFSFKAVGRLWAPYNITMFGHNRYQTWLDISSAWLTISHNTWSQICIIKYRKIRRRGHCMPITSLCMCIVQSRTFKHFSRQSVDCVWTAFRHIYRVVYHVTSCDLIFLDTNAKIHNVAWPLGSVNITNFCSRQAIIWSFWTAPPACCL